MYQHDKASQEKQAELINALADGYILHNNGTSVYFYRGKQVIKARRNKPYRFDSPTWEIRGRLSLWMRVLSVVLPKSS